MKKTIQFSVDDKNWWEQYAKSKGFHGASHLAKVALYQYESRHPWKKAKPATERAGSVLQEAMEA